MKGIILSFFITLPLLFATFAARPAHGADTERKITSPVTFNKDVAPIFFRNCAECHRSGEAAPMSLLSFRDARPWAKSIREKIVSLVLRSKQTERLEGEQEGGGGVS